MDLTGRVAVITGASRGIGAGLAAGFHAAGLRLGLCARSAIPVPPGADPVLAQLDVTDGAAVDAFAAAVEERHGGIDLWINNAGLLEPISLLRDADPAAWSRHIQVNVLGVMHGSQAYLRHRRRHGGGGVLVNISSGAGRRPYAGWSAYCAGKAAVDRLTECIAVEEADVGLRAYSVAPGVIDTDMQALIRSTPVERFPQRERFVQMKADDSFSTLGWVTARMLELAFDPAHRPAEVICGLPPEKPL
jgi:NAD(P)-dependent dehydrogenase (short-subunit alcohol dehydrogenase family)